MVNKILYVARNVKGITEAEIADVLSVDEEEYKELEIGIKRMASEYAYALGELFNVEPEYFMTYDYGSMQDLTDVIEKHRNLLNAPGYKQPDGNIHLRIVRMGLEASIAIQENYALLRENGELEKGNQALWELYENLKSRSTPKPRKPGKPEINKK
jgi:transcriptional regulator with XRE-family HTH domain